MPANTQKRIYKDILAVAAFSAISATAIFLSRPSAHAQDAAPGLPPDIRQLEEQRIDTLKQAVELANKEYLNGSARPEVAQKYAEELLEAQLENADTSEPRLAIFQAAVTTAQQHEESATQSVNQGFVPQLTLLEAKEYRLKMQIELAQEKAKPAMP